MAIEMLALLTVVRDDELCRCVHAVVVVGRMAKGGDFFMLGLWLLLDSRACLVVVSAKDVKAEGIIAARHGPRP